jgi:hypothetical protein
MLIDRSKVEIEGLGSVIPQVGEYIFADSAE